MSNIAIKAFGGMVPRRGDSYLDTHAATDAENAYLYSGELRPLNKPSLAHEFCKPDQPCFVSPNPIVPPIVRPPIPEDCIAPLIVTQPGSIMDVFPGVEVTFYITVDPESTGPLQYQWYKNGAPMDSETGPTLTFIATAEDDGAQLTVLVIGACGEELSTAGLLTVDTTTELPPECRPYSCAAYLDYITTLGYPIADAFTTATDPLVYPFSDGSGDGKYRYYFNIISAPTLQPVWAGLSPSHDFIAPSSIDLSVMEQPDFCGGTIQQLLCIDASSSLGSDSIRFPANADDWGDWFLQALITGHNGSSSMDGALLLNTGKRWHYSINGLAATTQEPGTSVSVTTAGNDVTITTRIDSLYVLPDSVESFTVLDVADKLEMITASVVSSEPYLYPNPSDPNNKLCSRDVTITVNYGGQSHTHTAVQVCGNGSSGSVSISQVYAVAHTGVSYPRPMTNIKISLASLYCGVGSPPDLVGESDVALARNYEDYVPPGYCPLT